MIELKLVMFGLPKAEINLMTRKEIQVLLHLLSYLNRKEGEPEA